MSIFDILKKEVRRWFINQTGLSFTAPGKNGRGFILLLAKNRAEAFRFINECFSIAWEGDRPVIKVPTEYISVIRFNQQTDAFRVEKWDANCAIYEPETGSEIHIVAPDLKGLNTLVNDHFRVNVFGEKPVVELPISTKISEAYADMEELIEL